MYSSAACGVSGDRRSPHPLLPPAAPLAAPCSLRLCSSAGEEVGSGEECLRKRRQPFLPPRPFTMRLGHICHQEVRPLFHLRSPGGRPMVCFPSHSAVHVRGCGFCAPRPGAVLCLPLPSPRAWPLRGEAQTRLPNAEAGPAAARTGQRKGAVVTRRSAPRV